MKFPCMHYVNTPPEAVGQHEEILEISAEKSALLLVNVYGLLLPLDYPARQALVRTYGPKEVIHREEIVQTNLLPVIQAARQAGIPVIYVADSAPNIGLTTTHIRDLMVHHLDIDPVIEYAESCNDPLEYHSGHNQHIAYAEEPAPQEGDFYIRKWVYSGFHATWLDRLLRNLSVEMLFCAGFNGDSDLFCTMLEGHWAGYRIVLLRNCHAAVHIPQAEPEMGFTQRLEMYAEASLGFTISPADFCAACGVPIEPQTHPEDSPNYNKIIPPASSQVKPEFTKPLVDAAKNDVATSDISKFQLPVRYFRRYPADHMLGYANQTINLDPAHTAFLVVDVYGETPTPTIVDHIAPALQAARAAGLQVIYAGNSAPRIDLDHYEFTIQRNRNACHYFPQVSAELKGDPREYHHGDGPWGRYLECVAPQPGDIFVRKIAYSGFTDTRLDSVLRHLGIENLISVGFSASECLLGTLIDAFNRNYRVILLRDCTRGGAMTELERQTDAFTKRMILWMETYVAVSSTSQDFIAGCANLKPGL
ncbi:MAG: isochorismatase family protein [Anaerolineae bacterium]|nr:isochorismatase family protein [Anaerolineae bacterium]